MGCEGLLMGYEGLLMGGLSIAFALGASSCQPDSGHDWRWH